MFPRQLRIVFEEGVEKGCSRSMFFVRCVDLAQRFASWRLLQVACRFARRSSRQELAMFKPPPAVCYHFMDCDSHQTCSYTQQLLWRCRAAGDDSNDFDCGAGDDFDDELDDGVPMAEGRDVVISGVGHDSDTRATRTVVLVTTC